MAQFPDLIVAVTDSWILALLGPLAVYLTLNGIDDLFVNVAWIVMRIRRSVVFAPPAGHASAERRIAIFVPLWHEHEVIAQMLAYNISAIRYANYRFFVGAYPNDARTIEAVRAMEARYPQVRLAVCPHDGPTSKADCLNWIYQHMLLDEERTGLTFDLVMTHDAEDLIHPESLTWINAHAGQYDFIQVPVLALPTPVWEFTHGIYCDEFAEFQSRDLPVRNWLGGFVPSAGVGTAYSRRALAALAETASNRIFEPECLTEDYENGRRLHDLGFPQLFIPPTRSGSGWMATREYFPRNWHSAVRQRTRWVTGISLQGWERHGWRGGWKQIYWLWRDRKGLVSSPVSLLTNIITIYAFATQMWNRVEPPVAIQLVCSATLALLVLQIGVRITCSARVYGWRFASIAPLRSIHANWINAFATFGALSRYAHARWHGEPLVWLKTGHSYPSRATLLENRRKIGEILTGSGYATADVLAQALATQPPGVRIGEHLIAMGRLTQDELFECLSIQQGLPLGAPRHVPRRIARSLPEHIMRQWQVLPFRIQSGRLLVASADIPTEALSSALRGYTSLDLEFHLVTPDKLEQMRSALG